MNETNPTPGRRVPAVAGASPPHGRSAARIVPVCALLLAALIAGCGVTPTEGPSPDGPVVRIGTYDSRAVALAYGRSTAPHGMSTELAELRRAHDAATAAGDETRVAELEARAVAMQDRIHRQVFGDAPIDAIVTRLADELPRVAAAAGVEAIVDARRPGGSGPDDRRVETVDVTEAICALFDPSAETRRLIADLRDRPPVPASRLDHDH